MMKVILLSTILFVANKGNADLINGGFENYPVEPRDNGVFTNSEYPGWKSYDQTLEIWGDMYRGIPASEGYRFLMLSNATGVYQDVNTFLAGSYEWSFAHRPRAGWDVLNFDITDLGLDQTYGTNDDRVLHSEKIAELLPEWKTKSGTFTALTNKVRISFYAENNISGNNGNNLIGNYIDSVGVSYVPTPGTLMILILSVGLANTRRRR
jgi:hypothetical protein